MYDSSTPRRRRPQPAAKPTSATLHLLISSLIGLLALFTVAPAAASDGNTDGGSVPTRVQLDSRLFPVPPVLRDNVDFWTQVYTRYDSNTVLLHDNRHLHVIYAALDFNDLEASNLSAARKKQVERDSVAKARKKYEGILRDLAASRGSTQYPQDQARIEQLFDKVPGGRGKYVEAVERIRRQRCLSDQFPRGIERSGLYMPTIERIFAGHGLPNELTRLPFVESLFQWHSKSKAAASGIWQFMPSTARLYMRLQPEYDERYNPITASDGAARLLKDNYAALQTWPLALTAYNHGRAGMKRAVRHTGTRDIGKISSTYTSRTFGFASRNFYSEFVSAATIYANRQHYFPGVEPSPALTFDEFKLSHFVPIHDLASAAGSDLDTLKTLNPALSREVWAGNLHLPRGYQLRVPAGQLASFASAHANLPSSLKLDHQRGLRYRVRSGDTLSRIASRHGTSASAIQRANGLRSANRIRIGQTLLIPARGQRVSSSSSARSSSRTTKAATPSTHTVRRGETLSTIAKRYGTSVRAMKAANGLRNANHVRVGQRLKVTSSSRATHTVKRGDTLAKIARRYGTNVNAIKRANRLRSDTIRPAQVLIIP